MKTGPKYKICRRLGSNIFEKCQTQKYALSESKKSRRRGRRRSRSDYAVQLLEKQKVRFSYGLKERQFRNYVNKALRSTGNPALNLFQALESRLDNVVYRLGLAKTRPMARQLVSHGHITVNGRKVTIPSFTVKSGDVVSVRENSRERHVFADLSEIHKHYKAPAWLSFNLKGFEGKKQGDPVLETTNELFDLSKVIEFYSR